MNIQQINKFILMIFDGPADETVDCSTVTDLSDLTAFLTVEGYITIDREDNSLHFTDKGYDILFKLNDGTNIDKLSTFGEFKKLAEKFYGQRQKMGNIE